MGEGLAVRRNQKLMGTGILPAREGDRELIISRLIAGFQISESDIDGARHIVLCPQGRLDSLGHLRRQRYRLTGALGLAASGKKCKK